MGLVRLCGSKPSGVFWRAGQQVRCFVCWHLIKSPSSYFDAESAQAPIGLTQPVLQHDCAHACCMEALQRPAGCRRCTPSTAGRSSCCCCLSLWSNSLACLVGTRGAGCHGISAGAIATSVSNHDPLRSFLAPHMPARSQARFSRAPGKILHVVTTREGHTASAAFVGRIGCSFVCCCRLAEAYIAVLVS
jgi:hypothetical protein